MATETATVEQPENAPEEPKRPGVFTLVKAVAIVSVIVLIEVVAVSMLMPTSAETKAVAESLAAVQASEGTGFADSDSTVTQAGLNQEFREVNLGTYHVVTYNPGTGTGINVDFDLYGTVLAEDEGEFLQLYESNQIRIREQVLMTIRATDTTDLTDAELGLIKRKILEKTNRALGKPLLHEAIFSKFSFIER